MVETSLIDMRLDRRSNSRQGEEASQMVIYMLKKVKKKCLGIKSTSAYLPVSVTAKHRRFMFAFKRMQEKS